MKCRLRGSAENFFPPWLCVCVWVCITFPILHKMDKQKKHTEPAQDEGEIKDKKGINLISLELELLFCLACAAQMRKSTIKTEQKSLALLSSENTIAMKKKTKWVFHCRRRHCWCYRNTAFAIKFICHMNSKFVCIFLSFPSLLSCVCHHLLVVSSTTSHPCRSCFDTFVSHSRESAQFSHIKSSLWLWLTYPHTRCHMFASVVAFLSFFCCCANRPSDKFFVCYPSVSAAIKERKKTSTSTTISWT